MRCHAHHKALNVCKMQNILSARWQSCRFYLCEKTAAAITYTCRHWLTVFTILKHYKDKQFSKNLQVNKIKIMLIV